MFPEILSGIEIKLYVFLEKLKITKLRIEEIKSSCGAYIKKHKRHIL